MDFSAPQEAYSRNVCEPGTLKYWYEGVFKIANIESHITRCRFLCSGIGYLDESQASEPRYILIFQAYRSWVEKQGKEEPRMPGLDYTHDQLFFINFAQVSKFNRKGERFVPNLDRCRPLFDSLNYVMALSKYYRNDF